MACSCKSKKIGQPTAVKQVVKKTVTTTNKTITPTMARRRVVALRRIDRG